MVARILTVWAALGKGRRVTAPPSARGVRQFAAFFAAPADASIAQKMHC
ncbi:hypothetical protein [Thiobacillus sedimenti]|uniref:Transposase n=1 Tax=Thiobacillus sedimenti TaxID=3110231 RepID=A0ABZ1CLC4_9PROT|nr:hypothetical protein [Thiobacillus sp. SCUT-2]WRS40185.1 hypothetical protein VA613_04770 [Thiobacillus sp. SCUT-2]